MSKGGINKNIGQSASLESADFELVPMGGKRVRQEAPPKPRAEKAVKKESPPSLAPISKQPTKKAPEPKKEEGAAAEEKPKAVSSFIGGLSKLLGIFSTVSLSEKLFFTENFRVMVKAGLSISEALETLALQARSKKFKKILEDINDGVVQGNSLGLMLAKYPKIFPEYFTNMIKVGELSGNLEQNLEQLSLQMKKDHDLSSKVRGALIYPIVILIATVGIVILMFVYVIPSVMSIFEDMNIALPLTTKILIAISKTVTNHGVLVALTAIITGVALTFFSRTEKGKKVNHFLILRLWIIGPIAKKINLARFSRTLSSLLKTDIPVIDSFEITSTILNNVYYKRACHNASEQLAKGAAINIILRKTPNLFPPLVTQMVLVGEKSGTLDELLSELANFYEEEVSDITKNLSSIIEPILIVFLGGVVGLIAYAIISPIYTLTENI